MPATGGFNLGASGHDFRVPDAGLLALAGGEYREVQRSGLIGLGPGELAEQLDWP